MAEQPTINLEFNSIVLIKSLEATEVDTTAMLQEVIRGNGNFSKNPLRILEYKISNAKEFIEVIRHLTEVASQGLKPLLNVDCHGDILEGLEFENGSTLGWEDLAECLTSLNEATEFNLIAVFSACFGAHFIGNFGAIKPAPCAFIIAPTNEIYPDELLRCLRSFYNSLFDTLNIIEASRVTITQELEYGGWYAEFAALWYLNVITGYVKQHCTKKEARKRVAELHSRLKQSGENIEGLGNLKRGLLMAHRNQLTNQYFNRYFMIDKIPGNRMKYAPVKATIEERLSELRATGLYLI